MNGSGSEEQNESAPVLSTKELSVFATTRWSVITRAREGGASGEAALEHLCRAYWPPVRAYLLRSRCSRADADDLTQEFFSRLLRKGSFLNVTPERGRFRNFLLVSLRHFLADEHDKTMTARRGGGAPQFSLDIKEEEGWEHMEIPDGLTPDQAFERKWAETVLARARERLRDECASGNKMGLYEALGPEGNDSDETYEQIGVRLGLSEEGVKSAAFRLRRRYRELIRSEVAETVGGERELEEELRHLIQVLGN